MFRVSKSGPVSVFVTLILLSLGACTKQSGPLPANALPPITGAAAAPAPSADDQLQRQLSNLGATPSDGGWSLTLFSAKFRAGNLQFSPGEQVTVGKIVALINDSPHLRVQIENYIDKRGPKARVQQLSQRQANAILRDLTSGKADEGRIQARGEVDTSTQSRVKIIFSNAAGDFRPAPVENS